MSSIIPCVCIENKAYLQSDICTLINKKRLGRNKMVSNVISRNEVGLLDDAIRVLHFLL